MKGPNKKRIAGAYRGLSSGNLSPYLPCYRLCIKDNGSQIPISIHRMFTDFPTVVSALEAKQVQATFMIVPLAMKLREQGVPVKICYLGHRDGSEIIVAKNSPARSLWRS